MNIKGDQIGIVCNPYNLYRSVSILLNLRISTSSQVTTVLISLSCVPIPNSNPQVAYRSYFIFCVKRALIAQDERPQATLDPKSGHELAVLVRGQVRVAQAVGAAGQGVRALARLADKDVGEVHAGGGHAAELDVYDAR